MLSPTRRGSGAVGGSSVPPSARPAGRRTGAICLLWAGAAIGALVVGWTFATPLMAAPDEPSQIANAAAVVRGQVDEPIHKFASYGKASTVRIPTWVADAPALTCFAFKPSAPASCAPRPQTSTTLVDSDTQFSNYPPLYFAFVGLPTLVWSGSGGLYAGRLAGDLLNCSLLALGLYLLVRYHPRRLPLLGAMVALSPMVFFVTSVVSDSGLEIAAAFATWCGGLCLIEREVPQRGLVFLTSLAAVLFLLARPISPVYVAIVFGSIGLLAGWRRSRHLLGQPAFRPMIVIVAIAVVIALISLALGGEPSLLGNRASPQLTMLGSIEETLRLSKERLFESIGKFGWLDTPVPLLTTIVWTAAVGALVAAGLVISRACRRTLPVLIGAIIIVPVVFESPRINAVGPYWQGRYWLPLLMGVPLVASTMTRRQPRHRRPTGAPFRGLALGAGGAVLAVAQIAAFLTALHRYQTGLGARPGTPVAWSPPGGTVLIVTLFVVGQALLVAFVTFYASRDDDRSRWPSIRHGTPPPDRLGATTVSGGARAGSSAAGGDAATVVCAQPTVPIRRVQFLPGWSATIDGRTAPVETATVGPPGRFQQVRVPAGTSTIRFTDLPPHETPAIVIAPVAAMIVVGSFGLEWRHAVTESVCPGGGRRRRLRGRPARRDDEEPTGQGPDGGDPAVCAVRPSITSPSTHRGPVSEAGHGGRGLQVYRTCPPSMAGAPRWRHYPDTGGGTG